MSTLVTDAMNVLYSDREPWPDNVTLYQPDADEQILVPDFATCLSVKTFLRMCHLKYTEVVRYNAEDMSPSGKLPFIIVGRMIISEVEPIVEFARSKGYQLSEHLSDEERLHMKAYIALIKNKLLQAELYHTWNNPAVYKLVTSKRYGQPYAWPLNFLLPFLRRWNIQSGQKCNGWLKKSADEVFEEVRRCCKALSDKLADQVFFFGDRPTELDAIVYGHLYTLLATDLPFEKFKEIIQDHNNLIQFVKRIDSQYFKKYVE